MAVTKTHPIKLSLIHICLGMNPRTIIDLETCQSNPKFETVVLVAKELNISVDAAIFPEMVNQTVSKTVVDFFARCV